MTSTLLRPPTVELELLLWSRQLQKVKFNEYSALGFLTNALNAVRNAKTPTLNHISRYVAVNEGVYALSIGSIYLHGLLPLGQDGSRALVLQVAGEMLKLPQSDRDHILNANAHRVAIASDAYEDIQEQDVMELVGVGDRALFHARSEYPDWFL